MNLVKEVQDDPASGRARILSVSCLVAKFHQESVLLLLMLLEDPES